MRTYRIVHDVKGESYEWLLDYLLSSCSKFGLVWRDQLSFKPSALIIKDDLAHLQLKHSKLSKWPGSELIGSKASVLSYSCSKDAFDILKRPGSLYGWLSPDYPEDLWFVGKDEKICLATVSHEEDAWLIGNAYVKEIGKRITLSREEGEDEWFT